MHGRSLKITTVLEKIKILQPVYAHLHFPHDKMTGYPRTNDNFRICFEQQQQIYQCQQHLRAAAKLQDPDSLLLVPEIKKKASGEN